MSSGNKDKMLFFESFADEFDSKMNMYDLEKRIDVVFNELLPENIEGKRILDAGCGTGWFSKKAAEKGAVVVSMDVGDKLLSKVAQKCNSERVVGSVLNIPFDDNTFDFVISSEVIEHIPEPLAAIKEMSRILKPGGVLALTTPNKRWFFAIWIANKFGFRPYEGLENWVSWRQLRKSAIRNNFIVEKELGIHLFPFVIGFLTPVLDFFHRFRKGLRPVMLNMAVRLKKSDIHSLNSV